LSQAEQPRFPESGDYRRLPCLCFIPPLDVCIRFNPASNIVPQLRTVNFGMAAAIHHV
jgi:hypothetical protein